MGLQCTFGLAPFPHHGGLGLARKVEDLEIHVLFVGKELLTDTSKVVTVSLIWTTQGSSRVRTGEVPKRSGKGARDINSCLLDGIVTVFPSSNHSHLSTVR